MMSFTDPNFTDPGGAWDWLAVVLLSAAAGSLALALPKFARLAGRSRVVLGVALIAATGAALSAVSNLIEDGGGIEWAGDWLFLPGVLLLFLGLSAFTLALGLSAGSMFRLLALVPAGTLVGILLLESGGGLLVLAAWLVAARLAQRRLNFVSV